MIAGYTGPAFDGSDGTVTSSVVPRPTKRSPKERYSGMVTHDRTGHVVCRVQPKPMY